MCSASFWHRLMHSGSTVGLARGPDACTMEGIRRAQTTMGRCGPTDMHMLRMAAKMHLLASPKGAWLGQMMNASHHTLANTEPDTLGSAGCSRSSRTRTRRPLCGQRSSTASRTRAPAQGGASTCPWRRSETSASSSWCAPIRLLSGPSGSDAGVRDGSCLDSPGGQRMSSRLTGSSPSQTRPRSRSSCVRRDRRSAVSGRSAWGRWPNS